MTMHRPLISLTKLGLALMFGLAASVHASADPLQEANRALRQGKTAQALEQVDRHLADKPKDAQGRFLKGTILTEMGRSAEAISIFTKLSADYPELPEPYNNLAVIYAQQKQYEKAKQALEQAIRTHPAYATAHENLGDLYARLATQAYGKALQLDGSNASAQNKLALIRDLSANTRATSKPSEPAKPTVTPAVPVAPPTPTIVATAPNPPPVTAPAPAPVPAKPEVKPESKAELKPEPEAKPAPKAEAKPDVKTEIKTDSKPVVASANADVERAIEAWAAAWARKDVKGYLARYAKDFKVPGGATRASWENERNQRITKPGKISVAVDNIKISTDSAEQVTAKFRQTYKSAGLNSATSKTLVMVKRDGKWLIQQERIGG